MEFTEEQQAFIDKLVGDARVKARTKAEADHAAQVQEDQAGAVQASLESEKKWKELAELHEGKAKALEPFEAKAEAYEKLIAGMLKDRIKALGDEAKKAVAALPESLDTIEKLDWLTKNEGLFMSTTGGVGTPKRPGPKAKPKLQPGEISKYPIRL